MQGSVVIYFGRGWCCSNEANIMIERNTFIGDDGIKYSKHTNIIRAFSYFNVIDEIKNEDMTEVVFKDDDGGLKTGYKAQVVGFTNEMLVLKVLEHIEDKKNIIKKIKGGNNYGK